MRPLLFYVMGLAILFLNKVRYGVRGYRESRPFAPTDTERAINYDRHVVDDWLKALQNYTGRGIDGKVVLELGPGADLGSALLLLDSGAIRYITIDANRLIDETPSTFYEALLESSPRRAELLDEVMKTNLVPGGTKLVDRNTLTKTTGRIEYVIDPMFDLSKLTSGSVDVVVSQTAFEHFSEVEKTIKQLSTVVKSGGVLVAEIDLMTHTGFLRGRDPLNIYRFPRWLYRLARFNGIPNRVRPQDYERFLEDHGWTNIKIIPLQTLSQTQLGRVRSGLAREFRDDARMDVLTFLLMATKQRPPFQGGQAARVGQGVTGLSSMDS